MTNFATAASDETRTAQHEKWMAKNCLRLGELDRERIADIDRRLDLKLGGSQLAANTANRIRIIARASMHSAIEAGAVATDAWSQRSKTRARRKVAIASAAHSVRRTRQPAAKTKNAGSVKAPVTDSCRISSEIHVLRGPDGVSLLRRTVSARSPGGWV